MALVTRGAPHLIAGLLESSALRVDQEAIVSTALTDAQDGVDFADALIAELGRIAGCEYAVTFDQRGAQARKMRLLS